MVRHHARYFCRRSAGAIVVDIFSGKRSNVADEPFFRQFREGTSVNAATFRIKLTRHDAFSTQGVQRMMEAADSSK
jgi:hypothetical protein